MQLLINDIITFLDVSDVNNLMALCCVGIFTILLIYAFKKL